MSYDLAIMYHYVQEPGMKGITPFSPAHFEAQLDWVLSEYQPVSPDELLVPRKQKPRCVITFDDMTRDQYEVAFPILQRKGIPAYFTVMSGPLLHHQMPVFHLVHTLLSKYDDAIIWHELTSTFDLHDVPAKSAIYQYETNEFRRYNKYAFNFVLSEAESRAFIEARLFRDQEANVATIQQQYISVKELLEMVRAGMTLGVHAHEHRGYHGDAKTFFQQEIAPCQAFLLEQLNYRAKWYTPAFGGGVNAEQMIRDLKPYLQDAGFVGGFLTRKGLNVDYGAFWWNRLDCIDLPPRKPFDRNGFTK
jgi:peptidoglycan/xylan/chitin deacetylase (PgdA/CDA1 family)